MMFWRPLDKHLVVAIGHLLPTHASNSVARIADATCVPCESPSPAYTCPIAQLNKAGCGCTVESFLTISLQSGTTDLWVAAYTPVVHSYLKAKGHGSDSDRRTVYIGLDTYLMAGQSSFQYGKICSPYSCMKHDPACPSMLYTLHPFGPACMRILYFKKYQSSPCMRADGKCKLACGSCDKRLMAYHYI